jgi:hypothetical protein
MQTRSCKYGAAVLCLLLAPCFPGPAQENQEARIYSAGDGDFALANGGLRTIHQSKSLDHEGFPLHDGDILQTGPGTFVEIRLMPRNVIIRAAENTTISYHDHGAALSLGLDYGRILLAEGGDGASGEPVHVRAGTVELVFQTGVAGLDYIVLEAEGIPQRSPALRGYVFSGAATLIPPAGILPGEPALPVNPMEMAILEPDNSLSNIEQKPLSQDIISYWDRHKPPGISLLAGEPIPVDPAQAALTAQTADPAAVPADGDARQNGRPLLIPFEYKPFFKINKIKNGFIVGGATLFLLGAGMETLAWYMNSGNRGTNDMLMYTGYGFFGLGFLSLGAGLSFNPRLPEFNGAK